MGEHRSLRRRMQGIQHRRRMRRWVGCTRGTWVDVLQRINRPAIGGSLDNKEWRDLRPRIRISRSLPLEIGFECWLLDIHLICLRCVGIGELAARHQRHNRNPTRHRNQIGPIMITRRIMIREDPALSLANPRLSFAPLVALFGDPDNGDANGLCRALSRHGHLAAVLLRGQAGGAFEVAGEMAVIFVADGLGYFLDAQVAVC